MKVFRRFSRAMLATTLVLGACVPQPRPQPPEMPRLPFSKVGVVPPDVEVTLVTFQGDDPRMAAEEAAIRRRLGNLVTGQLATRGFSVRDPNAIEASYASFPDLRFQTTEVQGAFVRLLEEIGSSNEAGNVASFSRRHTLGPPVAHVAGPIEADALLVTRLVGFKKSGGERVKDFVKAIIVGVPEAAQGAVLLVALVDGMSGDLLWDRVAWTVGDYESSGLDRMVLDLFGRFPLAAVAPPGPAVTPQEASTAAAVMEAGPVPILEPASSSQ